MSTSGPDWREVHLLVDGDGAERCADALLAIGALAVTFTDAGDNPILEPPPGTTPLWEQVCLTGLFAGDADPDSAWLALAAELAPAPLPTGRWTELGERPWAELWQAHFRPRHCGGRLWICPSWCDPPDPTAINLRLDPGLAFGTGEHPTTALCLEWLAGQPLAGAQVLDYGCGSGILAIASCLLGAERATAVDIDPQALVATLGNALGNALIASVIVDHASGDGATAAAAIRATAILDTRLVVGTPDTLAGTRHDVILANILANPLIELAPRIAALATPGARLCLSGILAEQAAAVAAAYQPWFDLETPVLRDTWARLTGTRRR